MLKRNKKTNFGGLKYNNLWIVYVIVLLFIQTLLGLPRALSGKESTYQCRRCRFDLWVGKNPVEKEIWSPSSILAWEIPWTEEPGGLQSMGSQRDTTEQLDSNIVDPAILTCKMIKASHFSHVTYFALAKSRTQPIHLKCVLDPCVSHSSECSQKSGIHVSLQMRKLSWISENVPVLFFLLKSPWLPALSKLTGLPAAFVRHREQSPSEMIIIQKEGPVLAAVNREAAVRMCKELCRHFCRGPGIEKLPSNEGDVGLIPGQRLRSHLPWNN